MPSRPLVLNFGGHTTDIGAHRKEEVRSPRSKHSDGSSVKENSKPVTVACLTVRGKTFQTVARAEKQLKQEEAHRVEGRKML